MEWENQQSTVDMNGGMFVKVMTDEQMELLRKQIAVYDVICEKLADLHKSSMPSQHDLAGTRLGNLYCDPQITSAGHRICGRQRWTPTPVQLQILERMFDQGNGTPSKQTIKDITNELSQHGQISETNVYNWFQNRRARSKRKHQVTGATNNVVESEVESPDEKKTEPVNLQSSHMQTSRAEDDLCYQKPESAFPLEGSSNPAASFDQLSFYAMSNPRVDQIIGKMEEPVSYNPYLHAYNFDMTG